jgi:hypothetical protein
VTRNEHRNIIGFIESAVRKDEVSASPLDVEADAIIRALFVRHPEAAYRVTKRAMALEEELASIRRKSEEAVARARKSWWSRLWRREERRHERRLNPTLRMFDVADNQLPNT